MINKTLFKKLMSYAIVASVAFIIGDMTHNDEPEKLKPIVVLSHFYSKDNKPLELIYRARITNDTIIQVGPETNRQELKFDFIYGNHDGVYELDNNLR